MEKLSLRDNAISDLEGRLNLAQSELSAVSTQKSISERRVELVQSQLDALNTSLTSLVSRLSVQAVDRESTPPLLTADTIDLSAPVVRVYDVVRARFEEFRVREAQSRATKEQLQALCEQERERAARLDEERARVQQQRTAAEEDYRGRVDELGEQLARTTAELRGQIESLESEKQQLTESLRTVQVGVLVVVVVVCCVRNVSLWLSKDYQVVQRQTNKFATQSE